ncbi:DUF2474 domain-containing protein [Ramlibacter albus]|uniref:DUF2474 domain-containing protein n=1 Tax=Ramlibacter albus TaxID=2079448 RepID=A0A923S4I2_9BURK|nr:DUF2474 domain-containing protein [Ramlibacter albus]MBC5767496.1 DUF2474 domain-containing protein [Ramlibacter albus]
MQAPWTAPRRPNWLVRIAWLVGIWACSVGALVLAAWLMRMAMHAGGLVA